MGILFSFMISTCIKVLKTNSIFMYLCVCACAYVCVHTYTYREPERESACERDLI